ncbi:cytochrome aa3 quinol oxidase subunit IV [Thermoflavimicrobium daqui]|uniref:Quinol oxidase subunit 4 n=1 Tax=Thermoflavimicrobium daqui TaxID=2137476 RepID=A0A364K124_9BACL|nr:cytochrome aa3 quinol oxidase subunit IV [Thermoflavimicrobium daqui]RAL21384.1 cytochrome aa3 quinol oxidase subunit IV [Thermoflavimicrobium daqui]
MEHPNTLKKHIFGFLWSLILTFAALLITLRTNLPLGWKVTIIVTLAFFQLIIQLLYFMHLTEGDSKWIQVVNIVYGLFVAIVTVAGSIWIMLYNTMTH